MKIIIYFLILCCFMVPIVTVIRLCRTKNGIEVDHIFLFSCGFIFYWIIPIALGNTHYFRFYEGSYQLWESIFNNISDNTWVAYFLSCLVFYISFIAGDLLSRRIWKVTINKKYQFNKRLLNLFLIIGIALGLFYAYPMSQYFFIGYRKSTQIPALGGLVCATILLLSLAIIYSAKVYEEFNSQLTFGKTIFNHFVLFYLLFAILLLSMGGRVIVISSMLMPIVFYSVYFKPIRVRYVIAVFSLIIIFSYFILLFRASQLDDLINFTPYYNLRSIFYHLFSENFNVSFSLIDFLNKYDFPALRFPIGLVSGLVTLIPLIILPAKTNFIVRWHEYSILSPQGGMNSFVSLLISFGFIGSMVFLFLLSFGLGRLKKNRILPYSAIYIMVCGWLGALFFRDLEQTLIKEILQFSILEPVFITMICFKISERFQYKKKKV